jgi:hypothetical protein
MSPATRLRLAFRGKTQKERRGICVKREKLRTYLLRRGETQLDSQLRAIAAPGRA